MRAVIYKGKNKVAVEEVPDPKPEAPGDAIIRITAEATCGSDLHMYEEPSAAEKGTVFGHENQGTDEEVVKGVVSIQKGGRLVLPFDIACGFCVNCSRGCTHACLTANPDAPTAGYGHSDMGASRGGAGGVSSRTLLRFQLPEASGKPADEFEDDFVLLADISSAGWHAAELACVKAGDSVAVVGAGAVGLLSAYSASLSALRKSMLWIARPTTYVALKASARRRSISPSATPVQQISDLRAKNRSHMQSLRPGEEKMDGVNCAIDAVGYQAGSQKGPDKEDPMQTIRQAAEIINLTGAIGLIGVYFDEDPGGVGRHAKKGEFLRPLGALWNKGVTIGQGQAPVKKYNAYLRDSIVAGQAKPSFIVTHRLPLSRAADAYAHFDKRGIGSGKEWTKILLKPQADAA